MLIHRNKLLLNQPILIHRNNLLLDPLPTMKVITATTKVITQRDFILAGETSSLSPSLQPAAPTALPLLTPGRLGGGDQPLVIDQQLVMPPILPQAPVTVGLAVLRVSRSQPLMPPQPPDGKGDGGGGNKMVIMPMVIMLLVMPSTLQSPPLLRRVGPGDARRGARHNAGRRGGGAKFLSKSTG
jgi:hypothetical protein